MYNLKVGSRKTFSAACAKHRPHLRKTPPAHTPGGYVLLLSIKSVPESRFFAPQGHIFQFHIMHSLCPSTFSDILVIYLDKTNNIIDLL